MLLTITLTTAPATDLGFLLHKNPARIQEFELNYGKAYVFYSEALPERCTACLLIDIDTVRLVRGPQESVENYVNDRPYVVSSFMSVTLAQVYGSAMAGRCKERQALAETPLPLTARLAVVQCRGGESVLHRLFEPLGYQVIAESHPLDEQHPEWGQSEYFTVTLTATLRLSELLTHLYVLMPVMDAEKHYWIGEAEVEKLFHRGEGWLTSHPEREFIVRRYLKHRRLVRAALAQLSEEDNPDPDVTEAMHAQEEAEIEQSLSLQEQRLGAVMAVLGNTGAQSVLDLGCGEGRYLQLILDKKSYLHVVGLDVSPRVLEIAADHLHLDQLPEAQRQRIQLIHGSLTYRDKRLAGYDAALVVEVIEHLDSPRLAAFERVLFEFARPGTVILTTPNAEYNAKFPNLSSGQYRHKDHRFEWSRHEFQTWATQVATRFGYQVRFLSVGAEDAALGAPTQMGVFTR